MLALPFAVLAALPFAPQLHVGDTIPPIALTDQDGRRFGIEGLRGRAVIVSFIYTRCTDSCALVAAKLALVARTADPRTLSVIALTLDPRYDRPAILQQYRARFGTPARWTLATGQPEAVLLLERRLGVEPEVTRADRTDHDDVAIILDGAGRIARFVPGDDWSADQLAALARAANGGGADPRVAFDVFLSDALARCGRGLVPVAMGTLLASAALLTALIGVPLVLAARMK